MGGKKISLLFAVQQRRQTVPHVPMCLFSPKTFINFLPFSVSENGKLPRTEIFIF